jgi:hypothetical protein
MGNHLDRLLSLSNKILNEIDHRQTRWMECDIISFVRFTALAADRCGDDRRAS